MSDSGEFDPTIYDFDPRPADEFAVEEVKGERIAVIRTSDRISFRRCRRRWGWNSHLRGNLGPKQNAAPLWMGTGFHFALEDCHGVNNYGHPAEAFKAYKEATIRACRREMNRLPADIDELTELSVGMLHYYWDEWLSNRNPLDTYFYKGVPQTEVNFRVEVPWERGKYGYDRVIYSGTLDRVIIDENGLIYIVEYKTAKAIQKLHLANDSQCSTYCWAGNLLYGQPIAGVIYQQHRKALPNEPKILSSGRLSTDKRQLITHASLKKYVTNIYGDVAKAPLEYNDFLNYLATSETSEEDKFVARTRVWRNQYQCEAEGVKILMEIDEMLNPNLPLYPNPDRTCAFMCPFNGACVSLDDGSDFEYELSIMMEKRSESYDSWRKYLELPQPVGRLGSFDVNAGSGIIL